MSQRRPPAYPADALPPSASDDALLATFFSEAADFEPPPLPSAGRLWWRAAILAQLDADRRRAVRAARPIRWAMASGLTIGLGAATLIVTGASGTNGSFLLATAVSLIPTAGAALLAASRRRS